MEVFMSTLIVLRVEGEAGFLLVDPASGTVRPLDSEDVPGEVVSEGAPKIRGVAEAYALPAMPEITSRKFYVAS
jgi:hypothetical protein